MITASGCNVLAQRDSRNLTVTTVRTLEGSRHQTLKQTESNSSFHSSLSVKRRDDPDEFEILRKNSAAAGLIINFNIDNFML